MIAVTINICLDWQRKVHSIGTLLTSLLNILSQTRDRRWRNEIYGKEWDIVNYGTTSYLHQTFALYIGLSEFSSSRKSEISNVLLLKKSLFYVDAIVFTSHISVGCVCILSGNNILYLYFTQHHISMRYTYCRHDSGTRNNSGADNAIIA